VAFKWHTADQTVFNLRLQIVSTCFADLGFKVDGGGATNCGMLQHGGTVDIVDRGRFELPETAWICLDMACCFEII
jgi:hypothetical protein